MNWNGKRRTKIMENRTIFDILEELKLELVKWEEIK